MTDYVVIDNFLPMPQIVRIRALKSTFLDVQLGDDVFRNIVPLSISAAGDEIRDRWPGLVPTVSFFRKSPRGQIEPNMIHTDAMMGDVTAILYLNPTPALGDGTTFWRHWSGEKEPQDEGDRRDEWADATKWEKWATVAATFNRLLLFRAPLYHSRSIPENYGTGDDARLIQVLFLQGALPVEATDLPKEFIQGVDW